MNGKGATEGAALGLLSYGSLALILSPQAIHVFFAILAGVTFGAAYGAFRGLPWKRLLQSRGRHACVTVHPEKLEFRAVSTKAPEYGGFIRFTGLDKKEAFRRLKGKRISPDTIPFAWRVHIEERRELEIPFEALEPHLVEIK